MYKLRQAPRAVLQAGVHTLETKVLDVSPALIPQYYGSHEEMRKNVPVGLLAHAPDETISALPEILTAISEHEAPGLLEAHEVFLDTLRARTKKDVEVIVMKGHFHISPHMSLYTGVGEEWAYKCDEWMKARVVPRL